MIAAVWVGILNTFDSPKSWIEWGPSKNQLILLFPDWVYLLHSDPLLVLVNIIQWGGSCSAPSPSPSCRVVFGSMVLFGCVLAWATNLWTTSGGGLWHGPPI